MKTDLTIRGIIYAGYVPPSLRVYTYRPLLSTDDATLTPPEPERRQSASFDAALQAVRKLGESLGQGGIIKELRRAEACHAD